MLETPDFDQIARAVVKANDNADGEGMDGNPAFLPIDHEGGLTTAIVEQLRLVWNARGAADLTMVATIAEQFMTATGPHATIDLNVVVSALRTLDR